MSSWFDTITGKRSLRHVLFWCCWIIGFTFVKSFGESPEVYLGWLSYYILTLPIFVLHTYLVAYLLIPLFLKKRVWPIFILLFVSLFYAFSVAELAMSHGFIFRLFPLSTNLDDSYLKPAHVIRSGVGNLYIVLVFLAARSVRDWYQAERTREELQNEELMQQMERTYLRLQPGMLLFAIEQIEQMAERSDPNTTPAIATTSDILNEVMAYTEERLSTLSREVELARKLVRLITYFRHESPVVEFFISGDPADIQIPPMILFSLVEQVIRDFTPSDTLPEIHMEISGFSRMIALQMILSGQKRIEALLEKLRLITTKISARYQNHLTITLEQNPFGCSVVIREKQGKYAAMPNPVVHSGLGEVH